MKIAHATDIHWFVPPSLGRLPGKRTFGTASLYLRGRRHHFDPLVQAALVDALLAVEPDMVVLTGDLTAQALPEEFALARQVLQPLLDKVPVLVQCGNHDVYTQGSMRSRRIAEEFADWLHVTEGDPVARLDVGDVTVLGLDPCRPHWSASGLLPTDQLHRLREILDSDEIQGRTVIIAQHYPVVDYKHALYDNPYHGLRNARELVEVLKGAKKRPAALLHGHKHHGYHGKIPVDGGTVHTYNPGSSGYGFQPPHERQAHFNVYEPDEHGELHVTRYRHDGTGFHPLTDAPYP